MSDDKDTPTVSVEVPNKAKDAKAVAKPARKRRKAVAKRKPDNRALLTNEERKRMSKGYADLVRSDPRVMALVEMTWDAALSKGKEDGCEFSNQEIIAARAQLFKLSIPDSVVAESQKGSNQISINITGIGTDSNGVTINADEIEDAEWEGADD